MMKSLEMKKSSSLVKQHELTLFLTFYFWNYKLENIFKNDLLFFESALGEEVGNYQGAYKVTKGLI